MNVIDEAEALRDKVDDLAHQGGTVDEWNAIDAAMVHLLLEGRRQIENLHTEMATLVRSSEPSWCWFETHAQLREIRELLDDVLVLRMCVQSRIFELEATAVLAAL